MNNFSMQSGKSDLVLSQAILIYAEHDQRQYGRETASFVTIHDVRNTGSKKRPVQQIMPGRPITEEGLLKLLSELGDKHSMNSEILPANVLSISANHMVWWVPATKRRVFFNNKELGKRGAVVPHPPLLFVVTKDSWSVFALDKDERPTAESKLSHSPYFNVYDGGGVCTGSAAIPKTMATGTIPEWESAFFDSEFTHVNGQIRKVSHERGEYAFWKEMLDGLYESFPMQFLVDAGATLGEAMAAVRSKIGAN